MPHSGASKSSDTRTWKRKWSPAKDRRRPIALSPDGQWMATKDERGLDIWNVETFSIVMLKLLQEGPGTWTLNSTASLILLMEKRS